MGFTGCTSGRYAAKHNPWVNFPNVPASDQPAAAAFPTNFDDLPAVSFVIPNLDNDMHDGTIAPGRHLAAEPPRRLRQLGKTHNSLFVLTFDEDDNTADNRIPTILAGQRVTPGSTASASTTTTCCGRCRTPSVSPPLANSATAQPILDVWTPGPGNTAPAAAFTSSCSQLNCSFDASASSDPDGTLQQYTWDFGDGSSGTGVRPNHAYDAGGTYPVRLTVADNGGATDTVTRQVVATAPAARRSRWTRSPAR